MNIGLALSGGGFRAAVFHFGVLDRLARQGLLEEVSFVSTVSGGSLGMSLVFALNGMRWPTSQEYLRVIRSGARTKLTTLNLQISLIKRALTRLNLLQSRALDLAVLLRRHWNVDASLSDLPQHPRWIINTTCYETGKLWRFERKRMGDYLFGYSLVPEFPLDRAVAASAAYPGLIGPLEVNTAEWDWIQFGDRLTNGKHGTRPIKPKFEKVHLWDGGVYDNLGIEPLYKPETGNRDGIDMLLISDASSPLNSVKYANYAFLPLLYRLVGIPLDQVRSLRERTHVIRLNNNPDDGCYIKIGLSAESILQKAGLSVGRGPDSHKLLADEQILELAGMNTDIWKMKASAFELLFQHGFETADANLHRSNSKRYPHMSWSVDPV